MTNASAVELYYDPYDVEIDDNPYPVWKRMREEAPLYYNEKYNFYALTPNARTPPACAGGHAYPSSPHKASRERDTAVTLDLQRDCSVTFGTMSEVGGTLPPWRNRSLAVRLWLLAS
jgi:hypothetical protein